MSDSERPDLVAFQELEHLIHALADEMAGWRRRAHEAEAKLKAAPPVPEEAVTNDRNRRWQRLPLFLHLRAVRP